VGFFFKNPEEFVNNLTYISLMFEIHKNKLKIFFKKCGIYLCYSKITSLCPINYTEKIIVNIVIKRCKYSYMTNLVDGRG
jgi:hypothetical protein